MTTVAVPEAVAQILRQEVRLGELGTVSEDIAQMTMSERPREAYVDLMKRFWDAGRLLDGIGWDWRGAPAEPRVDLEQHGVLVLTTLRAVCSCEGKGSQGCQKYRVDSKLRGLLRDLLVLVEEQCGLLEGPSR